MNNSTKFRSTHILYFGFGWINVLGVSFVVHVNMFVGGVNKKLRSISLICHFLFYFDKNEWFNMSTVVWIIGMMVSVCMANTKIPSRIEYIQSFLQQLLIDIWWWSTRLFVYISTSYVYQITLLPSSSWGMKSLLIYIHNKFEFAFIHSTQWPLVIHFSIIGLFIKNYKLYFTIKCHFFNCLLYTSSNIKFQFLMH